MYTEEATDKIPYTLTRGPVIYSVDMVWNEHLCNNDTNLDKDLRLNTTSLPVEITKPGSNLIGPVYKAKGLYKKSETEIILTPFTNIGQWFRQGEAKPNKHSDAFTYGIWIYNTEVK